MAHHKSRYIFVFSKGYSISSLKLSRFMMGHPVCVLDMQYRAHMMYERERERQRQRERSHDIYKHTHAHTHTHGERQRQRQREIVSA